LFLKSAPRRISRHNKYITPDRWIKMAPDIESATPSSLAVYVSLFLFLGLKYLLFDKFIT